MGNSTAGNSGLPAQAAAAAVASETGPGGCKYLKPKAENPRTDAAIKGGAVGAIIGGILGSSTANSHRTQAAVNGALAGAFVGALAGSQIAISEQADGSVKLNIPGKVLFATGSSDLSPSFAGTLEKVGDTLRQYCGVNARIVGHTDNVGKPDSNKVLSLRRATSVQSSLASYLSQRGITDRRLEVFGMGADAPVDDNSTEMGRAANRRVEIVIVPPAG
ncbi:OmpA family protein [Ideonella azotifigens]|uniref:OmpA-like domain-containing protein n=1 Tax=Ideonella azotifigens TaxID=513160 RepID=A0ABP3VDU8_9BURK|nr:OmpA family protein [Ideonella azotifigens]MCD2341719.1 OmpA family protein [Ideonella azotifigens]